MGDINDIWERDSKKYMHLSALRKYHELYDLYVTAKFDEVSESIEGTDYLTDEDILSIFQ